jgi:hypothetical protein
VNAVTVDKRHALAEVVSRKLWQGPHNRSIECKGKLNRYAAMPREGANHHCDIHAAEIAKVYLPQACLLDWAQDSGGDMSNEHCHCPQDVAKALGG